MKSLSKYILFATEVVAGLLAIVGLAFLLVVVILRMFDRIACSGDQCTIQAWLSATSGWAAVIAASVTAGVIYAQIRTANRHQEQNVELQVMTRTALARKVERKTRTADLTVDQFATYRSWRNNWPDRVHFWGEVTTTSAAFRNFPFVLIEKFESDIGFDGGVTTETLRHTVKNLIRAIDNQPGDGASEEEDTEAVDRIERYAARLRTELDVLRDRAISFVRKWEKRS